MKFADGLEIYGFNEPDNKVGLFAKSVAEWLEKELGEEIIIGIDLDVVTEISWVAKERGFKQKFSTQYVEQIYDDQNMIQGTVRNALKYFVA